VRELQVTPAQLLALAAQRPDLFPILLDSAALGALGRYSLLAVMPRARLLLWGDGRLECQGVALRSRDFLGALDEWWQCERHGGGSDRSAGALPFRGGWMVYLGYELVAHIEPGLRLPPLAPASLCALAMRVPAALIYDHQAGRCWLVTEADAEDAPDAVDRALAQLRAADERQGAGPPLAVADLGSVSEQDPELFRSAVLQAQEHIAQGDVYQANLSRGWRVALARAAEPGRLYQRLRQANPAPFAALATLPDMTLLSSSPERLVRVAAGVVETRPIAGTRARRGSAASDRPETLELLANPKERAEHVMLIDLERNDLGRICSAGSVEVNEFMITESYPHLHHIVSNVRGRLRADITPGATLRAVFPGGTITGCPKYRCMQLIGELEGEPRGAYTG
jgi:anthranilate synthase component 1